MFARGRIDEKHLCAAVGQFNLNGDAAIHGGDAGQQDRSWRQCHRLCRHRCLHRCRDRWRRRGRRFGFGGFPLHAEAGRKRARMIGVRGAFIDFIAQEREPGRDDHGPDDKDVFQCLHVRQIPS